jgi:hypothetical protein
MVESNIKFDESLKARNPLWGVRDIEFVKEIANNNELQLSKVIEMPANNLSLIFTRK